MKFPARVVGHKPNSRKEKINSIGIHMSGKFLLDSTFKILVHSYAPIINNKHVWKK
jgi:hypothetical protein